VFGNRGDRPKKKVYRDLVHGEPISPKHQRPQAIGDAYPTLAGDIDRQFFISEFGDVMNWWFADEHTRSRWRIQELPKTELSIGFYDSPAFGRRYEIFRGPTKLGAMEISASYPYKVGNKNIQASIELMWVRLLSWDTLTDFLGSVSTHINTAGDSDNFIRIQSAMARSLWDSLRISDQDLGLNWGELEMTLEGSADFYFSRRDSKTFRASPRSASRAP
jgi:hypothetical protein